MNGMEQPAASSGKVVINTLRGNVVITLHATEAPQQCSLFLDWVVSVKDLADVPCSQRFVPLYLFLPALIHHLNAIQTPTLDICITGTRNIYHRTHHSHKL